MSRQPEIAIVAVDFGRFPAASRLNPKIPPESTLLLAILDIRWDAEDPVAAVHSVEVILDGFSPTFSLHECRGPHAYRVLAPETRRRPRETAGKKPGPHGTAAPFDPGLALAHLIEHAVIDFQCALTDLSRCSGVTGARQVPHGRFDLMVECPDPRVGRCCLALSVAWLTAAASGHVLGEEELRILATARLVCRNGSAPLTPPEVARRLQIRESEAGRALEALREFGFVVRRSWAMNFSGIREYLLPTDGEEAPSGAPA
jgi:hypothetical protein